MRGSRWKERARAVASLRCGRQPAGGPTLTFRKVLPPVPSVRAAAQVLTAPRSLVKAGSTTIHVARPKATGSEPDGAKATQRGHPAPYAELTRDEPDGTAGARCTPPQLSGSRESARRQAQCACRRRSAASASTSTVGVCQPDLRHRIGARSVRQQGQPGPQHGPTQPVCAGIIHQCERSAAVQAGVAIQRRGRVRVPAAHGSMFLRQRDSGMTPATFCRGMFRPILLCLSQRCVMCGA